MKEARLKLFCLMFCGVEWSKKSIPTTLKKKATKPRDKGIWTCCFYHVVISAIIYESWLSVNAHNPCQIVTTKSFPIFEIWKKLLDHFLLPVSRFRCLENAFSFYFLRLRKDIMVCESDAINFLFFFLSLSFFHDPKKRYCKLNVCITFKLKASD